MKKREIRELQQKTTEELLKQLNDVKGEVEKLRLDLSLRKLTNTDLVRQKRHDIARILTLIRQRELVSVEPVSSEIVVQARKSKKDSDS